jgi:hypothetical protein
MDENAQFRPTVTGATVTPPPVLRPKTVERDGSWLLFDQSRASLEEVPLEVYLREFRDSDPADLDALARLHSLGIMTAIRLAEPATDLDLPERAWQYAMDTTAKAYGLPECADISTERRARHDEDPRHFFPVHAAEIAYRVDRVREAAAYVQALLNGDQLNYGAWRRLAEITAPALRDFHPRIQLDGDEVNTTLYGVAMLQMINDLAAGTPYLRCANENCRRPFLRQRGRSEFGGHRVSGVRYCDSDCARAQYQREKRRRDKARMAAVATDYPFR